MKIIFVGPRSALDLLVGQCEHHAVLTETGDWLVVANMHDAGLMAQVLAQAGVRELPHPNSGAGLPAAVLDSLAAAVAEKAEPDAPVVPVPATTRDFVQQAVGRLGMPALLQLLDR